MPAPFATSEGGNPGTLWRRSHLSGVFAIPKPGSRIHLNEQAADC